MHLLSFGLTFVLLECGTTNILFLYFISEVIGIVLNDAFLIVKIGFDVIYIAVDLDAILLENLEIVVLLFLLYFFLNKVIS